MSYFGTITVGRLILRETFSLGSSFNASTGQTTLSLKGQESSPPLSGSELRRRREDLLSLPGKFLPVIFEQKSEHNGFYSVSDASADVTSHPGELATVDWSLGLVLVGPENSVDLSSRLSGVGRANDFSLAGERWHAPPGGAYGYYTGSTLPGSQVTRNSSEGPLIAFRAIPSAVNPRWAVDLAKYGNGRSRVSVDGLERSAVNVSVPVSGWSLSNGLVKIAPGTSSNLLVSSWNGTGWDDVAWNISVGTSGSPALGNFDAVSIIRNDYELTTIRLMKDRNPGRVQLDLSLRRGSRFVEGVLKSDTSTTLAVWRASAEAGTSNTGYVVATSNDADGNKYIVGSAKTFTAQTTQGGLHKSSTTTLDFFIGAVVGGTLAVSGDTASNLRDQYLMIMSESTIGVIR